MAGYGGLFKRRQGATALVVMTTETAVRQQGDVARAEGYPACSTQVELPGL
jgi:hypothetical protein